MQPRSGVSTYDIAPEQWISIPVPALVEEALFDQVQQQLAENRQRARQRKRGARYLLQGLITCSQCGYAFYGKAVSNKSAKGKVRSYAYYRCIGTDGYRFGGERICDNLQVRTDKLDEVVWQEVCELLQDGARLRQEYQRRLERPRRDDQDYQAKQAQLAKVRQGMARLIDSYTEGFIEKHEFQPRIRRLRERVSDLEQQAHQIADEVALRAEMRLIITRLEQFAARVKDGLAEADWSLQRELIRTLVGRVEVGKEDVNVVFRIPPETTHLSGEKKSLQLCRKSKLPTVSQRGTTWAGRRVEQPATQEQ